MVEYAAVNLSSVNAGLKQAVRHTSPPPQIEEAMEVSENAERKVQEAANKLAVVNSELKDAVEDRGALEVQ